MQLSVFIEGASNAHPNRLRRPTFITKPPEGFATNWQKLCKLRPPATPIVWKLFVVLIAYLGSHPKISICIAAPPLAHEANLGFMTYCDTLIRVLHAYNNPNKGHSHVSLDSFDPLNSRLA